MTAFDSKTIIDQVQASWLEFQRAALEIQSTPQGFAIAVPNTLPDGWQMIVELQPVTPKSYKLSDNGRTLSWLAAKGQNVETDMVKNHIERICKETNILCDGWELFRWVELPLSGLDLHVFAEGLSNMAHLFYLHEPVVRGVDAADRTLRRVFEDRKIIALENHPLNGKTERGLRVDYFIPSGSPVAFQVLRRKGRIQSTMEQWGYRWQDLQKTNPSLLPAMLYDPVIQDIDDSARAIGEEVCALFCAYDETDRIHKLLERAKS